jgi:signal transduction histidine kinase
VSAPVPRHPLTPVTSIKLKLGLLVSVSVFAAAVLGTVAAAGGVAWWLAIPVAVGVALGVTQLLATGMTSPLREMTRATERMARGDYDVRVDTEATDEVGQLAAAFNTMARDLAAVDRERRDLVAMVSHELRTPLTALGARLENLVDGVEPAAPEVLAELLEQTRRLGALVRDLLDLSRVEAGQAPLRSGPVSVAMLVEHAVRDVPPGGRDVEVVVRVEPEELIVEVDGERVRRLVANLVDNAVRHSPAGGCVVVAARADGADWALEVLDEGPGVPPVDRERVFERFGVLDPSGGGTGLGLAIARALADQHGGTLRFQDPEPGANGARAVLRLPIRPAVPTVVPDVQEAAVTAPIPPTTRPPAPVPGGSVAEPRPPAPPDAGMDVLFGAFWPEPALPGRRDLLLASLGVGVMAAVVLPFRAPGLGLFLVLAFAGVVVAWASSAKRDRFTVSCAGLSALLTATVVLRDADWIVVLCVLTGAATMLIGATRGQTMLGFLVAGIAWPLAGLRGMPWLGRSARGLAGRGNAPALVRTALWSLLGLAVFGLLFASADAMFAHWVDAALPDWTPDTLVGRVFMAVAVGGAVLAAAYVALNPPRVEPEQPPTPRPVSNRFEWLAPVLLVDAVFVVFLLAQAAAAFGGHAYLRRTTGLTYADYVHQGFGQLTVATALTLAVVWAAARKAPRATPSDRLWLRGALGALCLMTLVVVASALYRMHVYQQAYGFTRLRLLVDVFEGWLGLVVLLVAVAGVRLAGRWLPRAALLTGAAALAGLALLNPDAWIAQQNLDRYADSGKVDWSYLDGLSDDATPTLAGNGDARQCLPPRTVDAGDWLSWNLGSHRAAPYADDFTGVAPGLRGASAASAVSCVGDTD